MRLAFLGAASILSAAVLAALCENRWQPVAAFRSDRPAGSGQPDGKSPFTVSHPDPLDDRLRMHGLPPARPVAGTRDLAERLSEVDADFLLCACCTFRIGEPVLELMANRVINVHPSALPAYRGPDPLFWQFRDGLPEAGLTLHEMTAEYDAGPIVMSEALPIPAGECIEVIEAQLGRRAGAWLADHRGASLDVHWRHRREQSSQGEGVSYQSWPGDTDYSLSTDWSAERAYRFMRGARNRGRTFELFTPAGPVHAEAALDYTNRQRAGPDVLDDGRTVRIRMRPGELVVRRARAST